MKKSQANIVSTILLIMITFTLSVLILNFYEMYITASSKKFLNNDLATYNYDAKILGIKKINTAESGPASSGDIELYTGPKTDLESETIAVYFQRLDNQGPVEGIRFTLSTGSGSVVKNIFNDPPNEVGAVKTYYLSAKNLGLQDLKNIKKIEVSLLIKDESTRVIDSYEL